MYFSYTKLFTFSIEFMNFLLLDYFFTDILTSQLIVSPDSIDIMVIENGEFNNRFVQVCVELGGAVDGTDLAIDVELVLNEEMSTATVGRDFSLDIVIPAGCPFSPFNDPPFAPALQTTSCSNNNPYNNTLLVSFVANGGNRACSVVTILPDDALERNETIVLVINGSNPIMLPFTPGDRDASTITITNSPGIICKTIIIIHYVVHVVDVIVVIVFIVIIIATAKYLICHMYHPF